MENFLNSEILKETVEILDLMYKSGWDERNGGNLSYLLYEDEVKDYVDPKNARRINMTFSVPELAGLYFLVTGTGKYFKNMKKDPELNLGLLRISDDGKSADVLWGYSNGDGPTSELSAHLMGHASRLKQDKDHRIVMHCHPANMIALSYIIPQDEKTLSFALWQMISECMILFPDGIGIVPWMVPGTDELGEATAKKMSDFRIVFWPQHGVFSTGTSLDDAFGLLETVEKAAEVYIKIHSCVGAPRPNITIEQLKKCAEIFKIKPREDFFER